MARSTKKCRQCKTLLKICDKHNRLWCTRCSIDCSECITDAVERGVCPKCWATLSKCDNEQHTPLHYCLKCDSLPNSPRAGCPICRSKMSKTYIDAKCKICNEMKAYCTTHGKIWCPSCDGNACLACEAALAPLKKMKINDRCRHNQQLKLCKICDEEKEKSGKIKHHCGELMAYCGTHKCYVCLMCDITSKCMGEPGFSDLVECEGDPQQLHWDWEDFERFQDNKQIIYKGLLSLAQGWPTLKGYLESYVQLQNMSQPEASEDAHAEIVYFDDALKDVKLGFTGTGIDEAADQIGYDDFEESDDDDYGCVPNGSQRHSSDANWGINQTRHRDYYDATYTVKPKGKVIVKVTEAKHDLVDEMIVYPFKPVKGEKIPTYDACEG